MKLVIIGAGEYGKLVKELASDTYEEILFLDDYSPIAVAKCEQYINYKEYSFIVAIGNPEVRSYWINKLSEECFKIATIISSRAYIAQSATIEEGSIIEAMAVVNSNAVVHRGCIINAGAIINHNAVVNEFSQVDCGAVVASGAVVEAKSHIKYNQVAERK